MLLYNLCFITRRSIKNYETDRLIIKSPWAILLFCSSSGGKLWILKLVNSPRLTLWLPAGNV